MRVGRIFGYRHLQKTEIYQPPTSSVFCDPADTEVGVWATCDLITPGCLVVDLGCGSGAAARACSRFGAGRVIGVDISADSIAWAQQHYPPSAFGDRLFFAERDFKAVPTAQLLPSSLEEEKAVVVASNPPYVPLPSSGSYLKSIYAGPDGLELLPDVLRHALALNANLSLTIGSYSSPRRALKLLIDAGYGLDCITLTGLELGEFTRRNIEIIINLERQEEAVLWRGSVTLGYLVVGLSCRRSSEGCFSPDHLMQLLNQASLSRSKTLESLSPSSFPTIEKLAVRILVLPEKVRRHHC